jgi:uncharacterized protein (DUF302 family)
MKVASLLSVLALVTCSAAHSAEGPPVMKDTASGPAGLTTVLSHNSAGETIQRFEDAVRASGWMVFARLDHAAAAEKYGQKMLPRTVIVYGNPAVGTPNMVRVPTLAIDLPPKVLVWQDDQGRVWLSYNSADYLSGALYARHGVAPLSAEAVASYNKVLAGFVRQATN